jgi:hypothetical protein
MIASLVLGRYQFLLTSCQEYVRKGLIEIAENLTHSLGIALCIRDGEISQYGPGERTASALERGDPLFLLPGSVLRPLALRFERNEFEPQVPFNLREMLGAALSCSHTWIAAVLRRSMSQISKRYRLRRFSDNRLVDLPAAVNTICPKPLSDKFVQTYNEIRSLRNKIAHLGQARKGSSRCPR